MIALPVRSGWRLDSRVGELLLLVEEVVACPNDGLVLSLRYSYSISRDP
jgi:hypothetical protein